MKMIRCLLRGKMFFCLMLLLCSGLNGFCIYAQQSEVLSEKPRVVKTYYPEKDTTVIDASLMPIALQLTTILTADTPDSYNRPSLALDGARYRYAGRNPTRPQTVSFTFIPRYKKKGVMNFSLSVEKSVVYEGEVAFGKYDVEMNGGSVEQQYLTVTIPTDIFLSAAHAKKVEFKLGSKSYKLNDSERKGIAALAATIESIGK